ncbi:MAG: NAD-dependent epimerase/dehydratase family protein [Pseudobdellovibrio sp.]
MKIAVTGATGGLGRSLTEFLLDRGIQVVALGRNKQVGKELQKLGAEFQCGEITDAELLKKSFASCDLVVHSAGLASPWGDWDLFYQANVLGTKAVLEVMRELKIKRLIYLSTPSLYFSGKAFERFRESDPLPEQKTNYGRSKLMADALVQQEVKDSGLNAVLLRPRSIFGKYDSAILPRILRIMKRGVFPLPDGGSARVDVTAVENVIHVIWLVINSNEYFAGEIFNITNDESMTVKDLTSKIARALNLKVKFFSIPGWVLIWAAKASETYAKYIARREPMLSRYAVESLATTQTLSVEKLKTKLGYAPVITLDQAIENYVKDR